jgi:hypothetical protein
VVDFDTIRDLGLPTIGGAVVGAVIAHYSAKARGKEEHERTIDLLVMQDERRAALAALDSLRDMRNGLHTGDIDSYGRLHNDWADLVLSRARLIRSDELLERARTGLYLIALTTLVDQSQFTTYALIRAVNDVEEWLEAWLKREDPPGAHLPPMNELRRLVQEPASGRISFESLNDLLAERA